MLSHFCFSTLSLKCFVLRGFYLYYLVLYYFAQSLAEKSHLSFCALAFSRYDLFGLLSKTDQVWRNNRNLFPSLLALIRSHFSLEFFYSVWPWFDFVFPAPDIRGSMIYVCSQMPRLPAGKWTLLSAIPLWLLACLWKQERVLKCRMF